MKATDVIIREHQVIREYIDKIQVALELLEMGEHPPGRFFELAMQFNKDYIERFHHFKEELVLFVKLAEKMGEKIDAHIDSLREQHNRARLFVYEIKRALEGYELGNRSSTNKLYSVLGSYNSLHRVHLNRENHIFIPLVELEFTDMEQQEFLDVFEEKETNLGAGYEKKCLRLLDEMTRLLESNYQHRYKYLLDSVLSKRASPSAA